MPGELPEQTGHRELIEEVGYEPGSMTLLTMMHPSAGMTDSTTHIFLATDLRLVERSVQGPEEAASIVGENAGPEEFDCLVREALERDPRFPQWEAAASQCTRSFQSRQSERRPAAPSPPFSSQPPQQQRLHWCQSRDR